MGPSQENSYETNIFETFSLPGPGARAWAAEIMRHLRFHGTGGHPNCGMPIAECGLKNKTKKIRNPQSEITGPMLSAGHALAPGPQPQHPRNVNLYESHPPAEPGFT